MRFRKLRIAWSVFWIVGTLALIVFWVRSYWYLNRVSVRSGWQASLPRLPSYMSARFTQTNEASEERDIECYINNASKPLQPRQAIRRLMV